MNAMPTPPYQAYYTIRDLKARWGVGRSTIYREIERGRLIRRHIGGQVRFAVEDVAAYEGRPVTD